MPMREGIGIGSLRVSLDLGGVKTDGRLLSCQVEGSGCCQMLDFAYCHDSRSQGTGGSKGAVHRRLECQAAVLCACEAGGWGEGIWEKLGDRGG